MSQKSRTEGHKEYAQHGGRREEEEQEDISTTLGLLL